MSKLVHAESVKLLVSIFSSRTELIIETLERLSRRYGKIDFISALIAFDYTDYYLQEMGSPLFRRFASFEALIKPESLPDIKMSANRLEQNFSIGGQRRVNIDPGYLSYAHLILATGKGYTHRPYLRDGIYADLTLIYENDTFHTLAWTYPDYATKESIGMFNKIRGKYVIQMKTMRGMHGAENMHYNSGEII